MAIDFEVKATGIDVSISGYRDHVNLEVRGVELSDLVSEIEGKALFQEIDLGDYIDWAEAAGTLKTFLIGLMWMKLSHGCAATATWRLNHDSHPQRQAVHRQKAQR